MIDIYQQNSKVGDILKPTDDIGMSLPIVK